MLDKWVVTPLAMTIYFLQFPSYAILNSVRPLSNVSPPSMVIVGSWFSMAAYLPPVPWLPTSHEGRCRMTTVPYHVGHDIPPTLGSARGKLFRWDGGPRRPSLW